MTELAVRPDLSRDPWPDLQPAADAGRLLQASLDRIGLLPNGTTGGRASVALVATLPDGTPVVMETTLALFATAARALLASPIAVAEGYGE